MQNMETVTRYGDCHQFRKLSLDGLWDFEFTHLTPSFGNHLFANYHVHKQPLTNSILSLDLDWYHEICATVCMQNMETVTRYGDCHQFRKLSLDGLWDFEFTLFTPSFGNHLFANYHVHKHPLTNSILSSVYIPKVLKSAAKIMEIGSQIKI